MIILYYGGSNFSCIQASKWFKEHHIPVCEKKIEEILKEDLLQALVLSEAGFPSLLKQRNKTGQTIRTLLDHLEGLNFQEGINFVLEHPEVLKTPLVLDAQKLMVGYNSEDLRVFLPPGYRSRVRH